MAMFIILGYFTASYPEVGQVSPRPANNRQDLTTQNKVILSRPGPTLLGEVGE